MAFAHAGCAAAGACFPTMGWHLVTGKSDEALLVVSDLREVEQGFRTARTPLTAAIISRPIRQIRFDGGNIGEGGGTEGCFLLPGEGRPPGCRGMTSHAARSCGTVSPWVHGYLVCLRLTIQRADLCETCQILAVHALTPLAHLLYGGRMYSPKIREDLIPRLYRISRATGLPMTALVNRYLEACVHYAEQLMAQDPTALAALEAALVEAIRSVSSASKTDTSPAREQGQRR